MADTSPTPRSVLDCNCGKKHCPKFEASDSGVVATDGEDRIEITVDQAKMLRAWLVENGF
jgi:hypothetical protein